MIKEYIKYDENLHGDHSTMTVGSKRTPDMQVEASATPLLTVDYVEKNSNKSLSV